MDFLVLYNYAVKTTDFGPGLAVKNTGCSSRGLGFGSQHSPVAPVPGDLHPLLASVGTKQALDVQTYIQTKYPYI